MPPLTEAEAQKRGISTHYEIMPNGESRYRLMGGDGSGYIRTESNKVGEWQKSHVHTKLQEMYIVQTGWMAIAECIHDTISLKIYTSGQWVVSRPGIIHNVYLPANTIIHTVKFGEIIPNDWDASPECDAQTKSLSESDIQRLSLEKN